MTITMPTVSMSEKHTPGPWHVVPANNLSGYWQATVHMSQTAQCKVVADTMRETNANARLIAAAPKMFQALTEALDALITGGPYVEGEAAPSVYAGYSRAIAKVEAAIAEAKGPQ